MSSIKGKLIFLIVCAVLLAGLLIAYVYASKQAKQKPPEDTSTTVSMIAEKSASITSLTVSSEGSSITFSPASVDQNGTPTWEIDAATGTSKDGSVTFPVDPGGMTWSLKGSQLTAAPDNNALSTMASSVSMLTAAQKVTDSAADLSEYGLDKPAVTVDVQYQNGKGYKLGIGGKTPDKNSYYASLQGDSSVYIIDSYTAEGFKSSLDGVLDKSLPGINTLTLQHFSVTQGGKPVVSFPRQYASPDQSGSSADSMFNELVMDQPYSGEKAYCSNIAALLLGNDAVNNGQSQYNLSMDSLVELGAADLSKYGLDNPALSVSMGDGANQLNLSIGGKASDTAHYCMEGGAGSVFTLPDSAVKALYNIDVISLLDRILAIYNINTVKSVNITGPGVNYDIVMNKTVTSPATDSAAEQDSYSPTVNGTPADEQSVKNAYQKLVALSYDNFDKDGKPAGTPRLTVTYNFEDASVPPKTVTFYDYNADFYAADNGGTNYYIINKQSVNTVVSAFGALANAQ